MSATSFKCLKITIYDGSESPMLFLRTLELVSGRIHRAAMQVRGKPFNGHPHGQKSADSVVVFLLKVEFLTADSARKALASLLSKDASHGLAEKARQVAAAALPSFALDEEDVLVDFRSLHDALGVIMRNGTPSPPTSEPVDKYRNCATAQRTIDGKWDVLSSPPLGPRVYRVSFLTVNAPHQAAGTTHPSSPGVLLNGKSMEIPEMSRPPRCMSEDGSYSSSSAPSAGSSTGSNSSVRNGSYIRHDDAFCSSEQNLFDLEYEAPNAMSLRMADILDDYEDLALEISKFDLITPTNDRGDAPWRHYSTPSANWGLTNASASKGDAEPQQYPRPRETTCGVSQMRKGEVYPPIQRPGITRDECTPRTNLLSPSFGVTTSPENLRRSTSSSSSNYGLPCSPPQSGVYHHRHHDHDHDERTSFASRTGQSPQHNRGSSYSSTATSQSRHSDYQSYDSKSTSSHSSTSTPSAKQRSSKKSNQDKRIYVTDPHKGPRPTDWMLSDETLKSRAARDARFMQIVAAGLAPGRTKAGWAQARRPGKRDRDAAKAKMRETEEEKERERLRRLLGEDATPRTGLSVSVAGVIT